MPWETYNEMWEENWGTNDINSIACDSVDGGFLWSSELTVDTLSHEMGHHLQMWFGDYEAYETIFITRKSTTSALTLIGITERPIWMRALRCRLRPTL